MLIYQGKLRKT